MTDFLDSFDLGDEQVEDITRDKVDSLDNKTRNKLVQLRLTEKEADSIDRAAMRAGYSSRSSYIRFCINEQLDKEGIY